MAENNPMNLHITALRCPVWAVQNGSATHIERINALLPGSIFVIRDYFAQLKVSKNTKANYLIAVKAAVKDHFGERYLFDLHLRFAIDNFFKAIIPKRDRRQRARFLSEEVIAQLIAESSLNTSVIVQDLYVTGRRVSEICNLRWKDISIESPDLAVATVKQKGGNWDLFRIPMWLVDLNRAVFRGKEWFIEMRDHRQQNRHNILMAIRAAGQSILGQKIHPHIFRHSFATHQLRRNPGKIKAIISQGGWSDARVFIQTYCHDTMEGSDFLNKPQASEMGSFSAKAPGFSAGDFLRVAG